MLSTLKNTHREKALSNRTPVLTKYGDIYIWAFGTSKKLFIRGS